jgi:ArsR family transcriptional regulator
LRDEELSVAELQEILAMGQSTISTHLSQLRQADLVEDRRTGKNNLYRLCEEARGGIIGPLLTEAGTEIEEREQDQAALVHVLRKRQDRMRTFFDSVAGKLGRDYVPGKSWKALAEALMRLMPPMEVADIGSGEGTFALMLSERAHRVIGVDSSARMIEVGWEQAARNGVTNVEFRQGDMEDLPMTAGEVDLVFFQQSLHHALHPQAALAEAARILRPGGRVVILDLAKHRLEEAREIYADHWLGFSEAELEQMLLAAGFSEATVSIADKDAAQPAFQTVLGLAQKPA